jgi:hypothetical protein
LLSWPGTTSYLQCIVLHMAFLRKQPWNKNHSYNCHKNFTV